MPASSTAPVGSLIQSTGVSKPIRADAASAVRQSTVDLAVEAPWQGLGRLEEPELAVLDTRHLRPRAKPATTSRKPATQSGVEGVGGGLHEENPERGILTEQRDNEVLVAAPDVVPRFEGHQHDVAHSSPR